MPFTSLSGIVDGDVPIYMPREGRGPLVSLMRPGIVDFGVRGVKELLNREHKDGIVSISKRVWCHTLEEFRFEGGLVNPDGIQGPDASMFLGLDPRRRMASAWKRAALQGWEGMIRSVLTPDLRVWALKDGRGVVEISEDWECTSLWAMEDWAEASTTRRGYDIVTRFKGVEVWAKRWPEFKGVHVIAGDPLAASEMDPQSMGVTYEEILGEVSMETVAEDLIAAVKSWEKENPISPEVLAATRELIERYRSVTEMQWKYSPSIKRLTGALGDDCPLCEAAQDDCTRCIHRSGERNSPCTEGATYIELLRVADLGAGADWKDVRSALIARAEYLEGLLKKEENR